VNRIRGRYCNRDEEKQRIEMKRRKVENEDEEKQREILQCRGSRKHLCVYSLIRVEQAEVEKESLFLKCKR
jgi:hypothetical protein